MRRTRGCGGGGGGNEVFSLLGGREQSTILEMNKNTKLEGWRS